MSHLLKFVTVLLSWTPECFTFFHKWFSCPLVFVCWEILVAQVWNCLKLHWIFVHRTVHWKRVGHQKVISDIISIAQPRLLKYLETVWNTLVHSAALRLFLRDSDGNTALCVSALAVHPPPETDAMTGHTNVLACSWNVCKVWQQKCKFKFPAKQKQTKQTKGTPCKDRNPDPTSACLKSKEREKFPSTDWSTWGDAGKKRRRRDTIWKVPAGQTRKTEHTGKSSVRLFAKIYNLWRDIMTEPRK